MSDESFQRKQKAKKGRLPLPAHSRKQDPEKQASKPVLPSTGPAELQELDDEALKSVEGGAGRQYDAGR